MGTRGKNPQYTNEGHYPKVAINNSEVVIEVHKSQWWNTLWCRVGTLDKSMKKVNWSMNDHLFQFGGCNPAIALSNDGTVIIAYQQNEATFSHLGKVNANADEITWQDPRDSYRLFSNPTREPSISMNEKGLVVVAAEGCDMRKDTVVFCVGTLEYSNNIVWKDDQALAENIHGHSPVVAMNEKNHIIFAYNRRSTMSQNIIRKLSVKYGIINADTRKIKWYEHYPLEYGTGSSPAVTMNCKGQIVRTNEENRRFDMYYEVGNISSSEYKQDEH